MKNKTFVLILIMYGFLNGCENKKSTNSQSAADTLNAKDSLKNKTSSVPNLAGFDTIIDGQKVALYSLKNHKIKALITNYGGRIVSLSVEDKDEKMVDVVLGFADINGYIRSGEPYFGALIGRYGNRIAKGKFGLDNKNYSLFINNSPNTLHGGQKGFQYVVWNANQPNDSTLILTYLSKDMEEGFPGNLKVKVIYSLRAEKSLKIEYAASTDKATVINLTNHAFFNLNGESQGDILNHELQIFARHYTPIDSTFIPIGLIEKTARSPFDFTKPKAIGKHINLDNMQLRNGKGYDHNFVLDRPNSSTMNHAAKVIGDKTGIVMDIHTSEPGLQFYSGNFMLSKNILKTNQPDVFRTAFALEPQHFPDSPNQPAFPSTVLRPGDTYSSQSVYKFSIKKSINRGN